MSTVASSPARPGRPTLADVAARAGVSASTASLAFSGAGPVSDETRARVLEAAAELGYAGPDPRAQSLRRGRSGIIGVVMEDNLRDAFGDPINVAMLGGISDELGAAGAGLLLLTDNGSGSTDISVAPMDAVILVGCSTRLDQSVAVLRRRGLPVVAIEGEEMDDVLAIGLDNAEASAVAARHLADLGHTDVAVVALPFEASHETGFLTPEWESRATAFTPTERLRGVREVFPDPPTFLAAGSTVDAGREGGLALLTRDPRPTAIIAQSDLLAVGVIRAAEEVGLSVPGDVSVIGFDGVRIDGAEDLDLTTLVQPAVEKGRAAGRSVIELLAGGRPERTDFTSVFRLGATTAAPAR